MQVFKNMSGHRKYAAVVDHANRAWDYAEEYADTEHSIMMGGYSTTGTMISAHTLTALKRACSMINRPYFAIDRTDCSGQYKRFLFDVRKLGSHQIVGTYERLSEAEDVADRLNAGV